jgi:hypothetical protein
MILLPLEVVPHVYRLTTSGCHKILSKSDVNLVVLVDGDGQTGVLVKAHGAIALKISSLE